MGQKNEELVKYGKNGHLLRSKIVYARSCNSARTLGKKCDARAFIGFENAFIFVYNTNKMTTPLRDEFAKPFFESSNAVPISIIDGKPVGVAYEISQKKFDKNITYFETHKSIESPHIITFFKWDQLSQRVIGDLKAVL